MRVSRITTDTNKEALVVPAAAIADLGGRRGVFQVLNDAAVFRTVQVGTELPEMVEILGGLNEGDQVITTGARALRDGDRVLVSGDGASNGRGRRGAAPAAGSGAAPAGAATAEQQPGTAGQNGTGRDGRGRRSGGAPPQ